MPPTPSELYELVADQVPSSVRAAGDGLRRASTARVQARRADRVVVEVRDGERIRTIEVRHGAVRGWRFRCTCAPNMRSKLPFCGHAWAAISLFAPAGSEESSAGAERATAAASKEPGRERRRSEPATTPAAPWRERLEAIRPRGLATRDRGPWADLDAGDVEVIWQIDAVQSTRSPSICVLPSVRRRLRSGGWSKPERLDTDWRRKVPDLASGDRALLEDLASLDPGLRAGVLMAGRALVLPLGRHHAARLLAALCATGRLTLTAGDDESRTGRTRAIPEEVGQALTWDDGPPYALTLCVRLADEEPAQDASAAGTESARGKRPRGQRRGKSAPAERARERAREAAASATSRAPREPTEVVVEPRIERGPESLPLGGLALVHGTGFVIVGERVARLDLHGAPHWLSAALGDAESIRAPREDAAELVTALAAGAGPVPLRLDPALGIPTRGRARAKDVVTVDAPGADAGGADAGDVHPSAPDGTADPAPDDVGDLGLGPRPWLIVAAPSTAEVRAGTSLLCTLLFGYGAGALVAADDPRASIVTRDDDDRWVLIARDVDAERAHLRAFLVAGGAPPSPDPLTSAGTGCQGSVTVRDLPGLVQALGARGWHIESQGRIHRAPGRFELSASSGIDWFELEGALDFEGVSVSLPALLEAVRSRSTTVELADGSVGMLPESWLRDWGLLAAIADRKRGAVRVSKDQGWILDALLLARAEEVSVDDELRALRERLARSHAPEPGAEPPGFIGTLRPYQREALGWFRHLRELGLGGCLADDMGLGKTVQILAMLAERRAAGALAGPSLVIAPRSLTFNWLDEARRFTPDLTTLDWTGTERRALGTEAIAAADLVVTTYGTLVRDATALAEVPFDHVILDESQAIKNPTSLAARSARLLRASHRLALSGTPIENHVGELWSLLEFLNPGMLGRSSHLKDLLGAGRRVEVEPEVAALLERALRPFFLRRTKEGVLPDLPERSEQVIHCVMKDAERRDYEQVRDHYRAALLDGAAGAVPEGDTMHVLEALLRLRQAACHPGLLDEGRRGEPSAKLETLLPQLREVIESGHKALVFSQFTSLLDIVSAHLEGEEIVHERLDGSTRDRKRRVARFQEDAACPVFLISLKAGGMGLNLTAADYVFLLDPWWNPAAEKQAIDRAHRIGQRRAVTAYRLVTQDTIEERVLELQERKRELAEAILGGGATTLRDLSHDDLLALLT